VHAVAPLRIFLKSYICSFIRGGIRIFKALATLTSNSKFLLAISEKKTRQNHVFAEHLYSVHCVCASPTRKIEYHVCVCVIIINKSPCQVCVCISESGSRGIGLNWRGKKTHSEEEKTLTKLASKLKNYSPIPNSTRIWQVGDWLFPPLALWFIAWTSFSRHLPEFSLAKSKFEIEIV
jgi:hypothetical protein